MVIYIFRALECLSCSTRAGNTVQDTSEYLAVLPGSKDNVHEQCIELYGEGSFMCVSISLLFQFRHFVLEFVIAPEALDERSWTG